MAEEIILTNKPKYRFSGPQPGRKDLRTRNKGVMRARRELKRKEAEARNAKTHFPQTAAFRRLSVEERRTYIAENYVKVVS